ncbi:ATPase family AAA domain-containing protein 2 [Collichthys lucidus]|uniref:ATPase family AAA domain-containing protein 2 n=1 Tax=Collichthys lucidus TaxID=240159 RepID=A0A4U5VPW7_COLLU|nr:ATPase family AAA domain-containing protein 2 [Collichthys lucidus]
MVTLRGRGTGDAERQQPRQQQRRPAKSSEEPPPTPPETRSTVTLQEESGLTDGIDAADHVDHEEPARAVVRKSPRLQNTAGGVDDEDSRQEVATDEDSNCSTDQNFDAKLSRASVLYPGPSSEFLRGTFRISASGPNTTRRGAFRPTKGVWSNQSDEDDSDHEEQNVSDSSRPFGLRADDRLGTRRDRMNAGAGLADIDPMAIDQAVGFDSIGGLSGHISALKEMVVFPLLYPEVFDNFKIQPPRGCLFYGPPGTGKTLVARALANECSHGSRKVAFYMRKGADCLSKWVGESERQLRLLFEQAYQMRPSIIFFDEIDGLAPVRSSRQDQIHSSIVSTLLALMDGLDSRGEVVVIGATNRLDSIDPALRRPGRFDREFLFGLPDRESRKEILKIHTRQWKPPPSEDFLDELAEKCVGYCGADIRAVCTEAALCALRRRYPQIYGTSQKLLLDVSSITVSSCDFVAAMRKMSPASHRLAASPAKPLSPVVHPLLGGALRDILDALQRLFPHAEQGMKRKREPDLTSGVLDDGLMSGGDEISSISAPSTTKSRAFLHFARRVRATLHRDVDQQTSGLCKLTFPLSCRSAVKHPTSYRPRMLLAGRPGAGQTSHLAPAVLHALERFTVHSLDSAVLFGVSCTSPEETCAQVFCEAKRTSPSILYIPHIQQWWETAGASLRASFFSLLSSIPSFSPILLLATCSVSHQHLDPEIQSLFREEYGEVYTISVPTELERTNFFEDLILNQAAEAPSSRKQPLNQALEILPVAPPPPPRQLSEQERLCLEEQEEDVLRGLRLFLRNVTEHLSLDRRFKAFTKPVDIEEVPDYLLVVKKPMDLSTLLTNIDEQKYVTVGEFMSDADLIWQNALEYNPDSDPMDFLQLSHSDVLQLSHSDFLQLSHSDVLQLSHSDVLQLSHSDVLQLSHSDFLQLSHSDFLQLSHSDFLQLSHSDFLQLSHSQSDNHRPAASCCSSHRPTSRKKKRYKRKSKWSTGIIKKPKRKKLPFPPSSSSSSSSSSLSSSSMSSRGNSGSGPVENGGIDLRAVSGSACPSSSAMSESSDGEAAAVNGHRHDLNGITDGQNGVHMNGYHRSLHLQPADSIATGRLNLRLRTRPSNTPPNLKMVANGVRLSNTEKSQSSETRANQAAMEQIQLFNRGRSEDLDEGTSQLVVSHSKLKDLLRRAVAKTDGAEVEPLEKLYALLAQSIYRHRNIYNKTELIQEMQKEVDGFS